jgi:hypothetical protein
MTGSHEVRGSIPLGSTNISHFSNLLTLPHTLSHTKPILKQLS